MTSDVLLQTF